MNENQKYKLFNRYLKFKSEAKISTFNNIFLILTIEIIFFIIYPNFIYFIVFIIYLFVMLVNLKARLKMLENDYKFLFKLENVETRLSEITINKNEIILHKGILENIDDKPITIGGRIILDANTKIIIEKGKMRIKEIDNGKENFRRIK